MNYLVINILKSDEEILTRFTRDIAYNGKIYFTPKKNGQNQSALRICSDQFKNDINKYLQIFMPNLTAKVFRTYNASYLFQKELKKITKKKNYF